MTCNLPLPANQHPWRYKWTCPRCGSVYVRKRVRKRWLAVLFAEVFNTRYWTAETGHWDLTLGEKLKGM